VKLDIANLQGDGQRRYQQDFFALSDAGPAAIEARGFSLVLADGMGGALDGAAIAQETVDFLHRSLDDGATPEQILASIEQANVNIYERYRESGGTTLIVARVFEDALWFASVGDSNVFLRRGGRLFELNRRHEFLFDLYARALDGLLSIAEAEGNAQAKALSSFIGCGALRVDYSRSPVLLEAGDVLLVCSDGVSDTLSCAQLLEAVELPAAACCLELERMIEAAALRTQDNYTAIVVRYEP
jgi:protein phosphatase